MSTFQTVDYGLTVVFFSTGVYLFSVAIVVVV